MTPVCSGSSCGQVKLSNLWCVFCFVFVFLMRTVTAQVTTGWWCALTSTGVETTEFASSMSSLSSKCFMFVQGDSQAPPLLSLRVWVAFFFFFFKRGQQWRRKKGGGWGGFLHATAAAISAVWQQWLCVRMCCVCKYSCVQRCVLDTLLAQSRF